MDLRRIVLLGHSGFVGSHLVTHLRRYCPDLGLVAFSVEDLDLTRTEAVERLSALFEADVGVVMTAGVKRQWGDTLEAFSRNLSMARNVCNALAARPVGRFLFFSSAAVYGEANDNEAIDENTAVCPTSLHTTASQNSPPNVYFGRPCRMVWLLSVRRLYTEWETPANPTVLLGSFTRLSTASQ